MSVKVFGWVLVLVLGGCDSDSLVEADRLGVGAVCNEDADCLEGQSCLLDFKGGYCGLTGCASTADCPEASACVVHDDGERYCFRVCDTKAECNVNRPADLEANCSSSVVLTDPEAKTKACIPPSD